MDLVTTLARALADDPIFVYYFQSHRRLGRLGLRLFLRDEVAYRRQRGGVCVHGNAIGLVGYFPDRDVPLKALSAGTRLVCRLLGGESIRRWKEAGILSSWRPEEGFDYLSAICVPPADRRKGDATRLIQSLKEKSAGLCLEVGMTELVSWYVGLGFVVSHEGRLPEGPKVWTMTWSSHEEPTSSNHNS